MKNCSEIVRGADCKSVTCEVDEKTLKRTMIYDFGAYQVRLDDYALVLAQRAVEAASDLLMARYDAAPPDSDLRRVIDLYRAEEGKRAAQYAAAQLTGAMIDAVEKAKHEASCKTAGNDPGGDDNKSN